jgi:puromycin-sensitive aminopeptidase
VPAHYEIDITPNFEELTFRGNVSIDVDVVEPVSNILINAHQLDIGAVTVEDISTSTSTSSGSGSGTSFSGSVSLDDKLQRADIKVQGTLGRGKWRLKMAFAGILNDELKGFYRSIWKDESGKEHIIATTQFEACDARRAFPCFDEPEFKATFKVVMNIPHAYQALSAMREVSVSTMSAPPTPGLHTPSDQEESPLLKRVEFDTTPVMSTYFLAFMAGELECGGSVKVNGKELRFWSTPGKSHQLNFAKGIAAFSLETYEKYFGIGYHGGDKIDFVAVPDFAAGAMENLGCIIYRETDLLCDEATATQGDLERVAHVIAHELAHMWFGDYATMRWWNGLWLNESFATYMENKVVDLWKPEWLTWDAFAAERVDAFGLDQLKSTHAIEVAVENPLQIDEIFDLISYQKGCSVLRMLEQYIGDAAFRRGSQIYLKTHALGNTETYDLWDALEQGCHETGVDVPVRKIMDGWVFTSGHPVVTVNRSKLAGFIELSQREFKVLNEGAEALAHSPLLWPIPVTLKAKTKAGVVEQKFLFNDRAVTVYIGEEIEWVVVNAGGSGFYRVLYSNELATALVANKKLVMTEVDRYNFLSDTWACVRARLVSMYDYLKITEQFMDEEDPKVWGRIIAPLNYLHGVTEGPVKAAIESRLRHHLVPILDRVGLAVVDGESVRVTDLRNLAISNLGTTANHAPVVDHARAMYTQWKVDPASVDSDVFAKMVNVLAHNGDKGLHSEFNDLRVTAKTPQDQTRFMYALTSFRKPELITATIKLALSGEIRVQDAAYFFASILGNEDACLETWQATKDNWGKITEMWTAYSVPAIFDSLISLDTPALEADVVDFFTKKNTIEFGQMQLAQGLEQLRIGVLLRQAVEADRARLDQYLLPIQVQSCIAPDPEKKSGSSCDKQGGAQS